MKTKKQKRSEAVLRAIRRYNERTQGLEAFGWTWSEGTVKRVHSYLGQIPTLPILGDTLS